MKVYKANRNGFVVYLLAGILLLTVVIFLLDRATFTEKPFILLPLISPIALLAWIYFDTSYSIENDRLRYRSAFIRGEINVGSIREIIVGKTMWNGVKPALAKNGLIIKYNKYDDIYLAPENNQELVADLLKINHTIEVVEQVPVSRLG